MHGTSSTSSSIGSADSLRRVGIRKTMFTAGRLASMIAFALLFSLEGALGCHHDEPCMCGACNDLDECVSHVQPDPSSGPSLPLPVPVTYQLQVCGAEEIEVAFSGCNKKVPYTSDKDGVFDIAPPTALSDMMAYGCFSPPGTPVGLYPYITVYIGNKEIQVDASCSKKLYHGKFFGFNDEIRLVGSCIEDEEDGTRCHTLDLPHCSSGDTDLPSASPSEYTPSNGGCDPFLDGVWWCMCGTCKGSCAADDVDHGLSCGAGCQYESPGDYASPHAPVTLELQICEAERIEVGFSLCHMKVPFESENGVFLIKPPSSLMEIEAYQCIPVGLKTSPYITVYFGKKEIEVDASCFNPLYHGQFFGENDEIQIAGSCTEYQGYGRFCNHLDVTPCSTSGISSLGAGAAAPCVRCTDRPTQWMESAGKDCVTATRVIQKQCNASDRWASEKYCQRSCFEAGRGYDGVVCCE